MFSQGSVTTLHEYTFVQTFTTQFMFVCGNIIAAVCFVTSTKLLCTSELFFEESRLSLVIPLVLVTAPSGENIRNCISSKTVSAILRPQPLPVYFMFCSYTIFQFLFGKNKIPIICVHFQLFEFLYATKFGGKVVVQFQHWYFCVLQGKKVNKD